MKLPRLAQILLTAVLIATAGGFATSAQFYSESLSSPFFAIALISVVIVQLRVGGLWPDGLALLAATALLALIDFRFLHYHQHFMAWFSFLGLCALLLLALRAVWSQGERRKLLLYALLPSLLFVTSEWFASNMLDLTERLHPKTLDLFLYSFDGSLRVQLSFLMGQAFAMWPWFRIAGELFYIGLPIPIALVYSGQLLRVRERAFPAMAAFLLTGPIGILFYNLFPAMGPIHLVHRAFPWQPLNSGMFRLMILEPVAIRGPRNAIPSLHMGWVLLTWWYSRGLSFVERAIVMLFVIFTACATMGTGEHYFIDLVVAFPFALFMVALCDWPPFWANRARLSALLVCLATILLWFAGLRYAPHFFWTSPIIPWALCVFTVALAMVLKRRLGQADAPSKPVPSFANPENPDNTESLAPISTLR
jgi:PAP2 superfamily